MHMSRVLMCALLYVGFLVRAVAATGCNDLVVMSSGWGPTWVSVCLGQGGPGARKEAEVRGDCTLPEREILAFWLSFGIRHFL